MKDQYVGLLIAGGGDDIGGNNKQNGDTAELFLPTLGFQCWLTDLPSEHHKAHHIQLEDLLCGGFGVTTQYSGSCIRDNGDSGLTVTDLPSLRWRTGGWEVVGPGLARGDAPGWRTGDGILVFGGWSEEDQRDLAEVRLLDNDFYSSG